MSYRVLVMGGSYFLGRIFSIFASRAGDMELTLLNRGRYSMAHLERIRELRCDRRDVLALDALPRAEYDAVVDLCAYRPGDIRLTLEHLPGSARRYILVSTADVYRRSALPRDERAPLLESMGAGAEAEYTYHKRLLEAELLSVCGERKMETVILRPAFLYGPYNYAPRESWYIEKIVRGEPIPVPTDAAGRFQFVFVKDAAEAILACIREEKAAGEAYNLSAPEILDYPAFMDTLEAVSDLPFTTRPVTVEEVLREGIPLPFPLKEAESELFSGEKLCRELGISYTPFREGMEKTYRAFKSVYL